MSDGRKMIEPTKGERTTQRILDAAEAIFSQTGYEGSSLRDIAARANIRQPGLYNYFASKEELYRAVLDRGLQPLADLMDEVLASPVDEPDMLDLPGRMTDILATHPNIPSLLIRAFLSADHIGKMITLDWLERLLESGRLVNAARSLGHGKDNLVLQQVAWFNLCCGYFWTAPMVQRLTGKAILATELLDLQKQLLRRVTKALVD